jgi:hypothetical protein
MELYRIFKGVNSYTWNDIAGINTSTINSLFTVAEIYIRFPEITITNSQKGSFHIKELWVNFSVDKEFKVSHPRGMRSFLTLDEAKAGYFHSHLHCRIPTSPTYPPKFDEFCLGSGEINQVLRVLWADGFDKINFMLFCLHLKNMVAWESIEGNPYIQFSSISARGRGNTERLNAMHHTIIMRITERLKLLIEDSPLGVIKKHLELVLIGEDLTIRDSDHLNLFLTNLLKVFNDGVGHATFARMFNDTIDRFLVKKASDGQFYSLNSGESENRVVREPTEPIFIFKDKPIYLKIEGLNNTKNNEQQTTQKTDENEYLHPTIVQQFCKSYRADFKNCCYRYETVIKSNSFDNFFQTTRPDLLPV